jgi:hypothetical protein
MRLRLAIALLTMACVITSAAAAFADDKPAGKTASCPAFEKIKKLAGDWVMVKDGKPTDEVVSSYRVTAGGTAVVETIFPGSGHEMVTVYTAEGPELFLTHYCVLGNQPRLKADQGTDANKLVFKCVGGGNLKPEKDSHMGVATVTFLNDNEMKSEWTRCEDGKACETHAFHVVRKKK